MSKRLLGISVLQAAQERIAWAFDVFPRLYVAFSAGKDSTVMLHLVMAEAKRRKRKVGLLLVDLEGQYRLTIEHGLSCFEQYREYVEPYWVALPLNLRNAVSMYEPQWCCWAKGREQDWVRKPPAMAITDPGYFPFYHYQMEFEEFVPAFGTFYSQGQPTACFVGIRTQESLNRWRTIAGHGTKYEGRNWTNLAEPNVWNVYPIYDWRTEDIWIYHGKTGMPYNRLYDLMHKAGLSIHQMRICQPYGDDQRKGLWLFHLIEPETWSRIVARVNGANSGALYVQERGSINGTIKISKPEGHTWHSFAKLLLGSLPPRTRENFENKITIFIKWWNDHGVMEIPDEMSPALENKKAVPSWRRICKAILRNDFWCKSLSFGQHKTQAFERYRQLMKKRRTQWKIVW